MAEDLEFPDEAPTAEEEAVALEQALEGFGEESEATIVADEPPPIGRSWAFDFAAQRLVTQPNGKGPAETYGEQTLTTWCIKALQTAQGAHPIYASDYGMRDANRWVGRRLTGADYAQLEADIHDALTFHPRIVNVVEFDAYQDPDSEVLEVSFTVVLDDDERVALEGVEIGGE